jgi:hypothetical protein
MHKKVLVMLAVLALASVAAFAASKDGIVLSKDGRTVTTTKPTKSVTKAPVEDPSLIKIYDNIGTAYPKGKYWCCEGATVFGPTAISGEPEFWEASAFTPSANHTVTKILVAVGYVEGYNGLVIALYNDASGVPGTKIKSWGVTNLGDFGSCCTVATANDAAGIAVTSGTQYWVVVKTNGKSSNTFAAWNVNDTDQVDPEPSAFWCSDDKGGSCGSSNDTWIAGSEQPGLAFAVEGTN